jgi:serpin B
LEYIKVYIAFNNWLLSKMANTGYENKVANGDLHFGLSIVSHLGEGNISVSPTSLRVALGMLYEGARGGTAKQIARVAGLPEDAEARHTGVRELMSVLNATVAPYKLRCANGIWVAQNFLLNPDFKSRLTDSYLAEARTADFEGSPDKERAGINDWVSGKTEGKIPVLFPEGSITSLTVLALANALYFKASWENKFDEKLTQKQDFTLPSGEVVQVDMMRKGVIDRKRGEELPKFGYREFDGVQVALLPYEGDQLSKLVMLPPKGTSVQDLEAHIKESGMSSRRLYDVLDEADFVRLELPRHEVKGDYDLKAPLEAMGIDKMWKLGVAELGGIGPGNLFVSKGVHQTYFKTNEEGSEGAAATGFAVSRECCMEQKEPVEFVVDRPYLEAVVEQKTGAMLFLNRVEDPR